MTDETALSPVVAVDADARRLTPSDAERIYHVPAWGSGYFFVNDRAHAAVRPLWNDDLPIDLHEVVEQLKAMGVRFPALIRFQDLLQARVIRLNESFRKAIAETGYRNAYQGVFPVKVNQLREVVEEIVEAGERYGYGLECGSKGELVATLPYLKSDGMPLICNGCKDAVMMRLMLAGQQLGQNVLPVIERYEEFELWSRLAAETDGMAPFGVRVRLSTSGAGLWSESGGENSKFGISLTELLRLVDRLKAENRMQALRLLHFHLGSQIADLANVRQAVQEGGRLYAQLRKRGIRIAYFDIGGGLGVSYEAGNPDVAGNINYTLDEYTREVVATLGAICDDEGVPHPILVSESGRAVTAFHSVLVIEVVDTRVKDRIEQLAPEADDHALLAALRAVLEDGNIASADSLDALQDVYQEAERVRAGVTEAFREGRLSLEQKAQAERLFWSICHEINDGLQRFHLPDVPEALRGIDPQLVDHYLCNFSVFRSTVDYWAIGQRFPIMPLHRLDEEPTRRATLADLTCDSDGQIKGFVAPEGNKHFLELHPLRPDEPYYLGIFLMGAYQDIMGDMHNLFGRVTEAHVYADAEEPGNFYIEKILPGASVEEQLALVQYFPNDLERRMNNLILRQVRAGRVRPKEGVRLLEQYKQVFRDQTYFNTEAR